VFGAACLALAILGIALRGTEARAAAPCANEAIRQQQQATGLGDCRAWEMVSPAEKSSADVLSTTSEVAAAAQGGAVKFASLGSFASPEGANLVSEYLARRSADGWHTEGLIPRQSTVSSLVRVPWISPDLAKTVIAATDDETPLAPGAAPGALNLFLRDNPSATLSLVTLPSGGLVPPVPSAPIVTGATADGGHVVFSTTVRWTADAPASGSKLYEYDAADHVLRLVGIQPNSTAPVTGGAVAGSQFNSVLYPRDPISDDGERIYFSSPASAATARLYLRIGGAETVLVSESEATQPEEPKSALFQGMSRDGSIAFFVSTESLVDEDTDGGLADLYAYDATKPPTDPHNLTLLSGGDELAAAGTDTVAGAVAVAGSGSRVYFVAQEGSPPAGLEVPAELFLWEAGQPLRHVATLSGPDGRLWSQRTYAIANNSEMNMDPNRVRIDPSGRLLAFISATQLTDSPTAGLTQVYLYDADRGTMTCASCPADGSAPSGSATFGRSATEVATAGGTTNLSRVIVDGGRRLYFDTPTPLVPADSNGVRDVYEYSITDGTVRLISTGGGEYPALVGDASADGSDVFFFTRQQLVPGDGDHSMDLYDARAGGGFAAAPGQGPPCAGDACQAASSAPPAYTPPATRGVAGASAPRRNRCAARTAARRHPQPQGRKAHRGRSAAKKRRSERRQQKARAAACRKARGQR
jgi:hypothetical protein